MPSPTPEVTPSSLQSSSVNHTFNVTIASSFGLLAFVAPAGLALLPSEGPLLGFRDPWAGHPGLCNLSS